MAANIPPLVRLFVPCTDVVLSAEDGTINLASVLIVATTDPEEGDSIRLSKVTLFAVLVNGRGVCSFTIELVELVGVDGIRKVAETHSVDLELGNDPTICLMQSFPIRNVWFPNPGVYQFLLRCDDAEIATVAVDVR